ncbi:MAG: NADH-quinone oxidoreductase subunit NuoK [Polyangiaceae bacterium]
MTLSSCLLLATALFAIGLYGLVTRRQAIAVLLCVELMANAANVCFVAFGSFRGGITGQVFAAFSIALTVAEVAVGLAIVILLYRRYGDTLLDLASEMKR